MTQDRRAVIRLLGVVGMAAVAAPVARAAGLAAKLLAGRAPLARNTAPSRAAAPGQVALIIVDSYNDFLSEEGLTWPMLKLVAEENDLVENLLSLVAAARAGAVRIAFAPHHRYREGSFSGRKHLNPSQNQKDGRLNVISKVRLHCNDAMLRPAILTRCNGPGTTRRVTETCRLYD